MKKIKAGSDFSGVGAFDFALKRVSERKGFEVENVFACDMDKFARLSYLENHKEPNYYPENVYNREIPKESLDIYMTSPPCQSFSLAGKRKGKDSVNGVLFFNSHEFIKKNQPRFFIFENVKGLLSDDGGKTFQEWINWLGGKSVNGLPILFKDENAVDYHIYWRVLNSKEHGVPQNRERVFIIGIRDDNDNVFSFPKEEPLTRKLKDVLEDNVDPKYFLSEKMVSSLLSKNKENNGFTFKPTTGYETASCITARCFKMGADDNYIKVKSATKRGYETATRNDSINFSVPGSETRRGRVGKEVAQTLDTSCNQGVLTGVSVHPFSKKLEFNGFKDSECPTLLATDFKAPKCVQFDGFKIRKLTPRECFRLQDFPDSFKFVCSNSQLYKQAGNSITVRVLEKIIDKLTI